MLDRGCYVLDAEINVERFEPSIDELPALSVIIVCGTSNQQTILRHTFLAEMNASGSTSIHLVK